MLEVLQPVEEPCLGSEIGTPLVSVIVPCVNGLPSIVECLQSLMDQAHDGPLEVIVVDRCGESVRRVVRERFPDVKLVAVDGPASIPALRARGLQAARGEMIAVTEDHCLVGPGWL